jgi:Ca2+-transporting ATPase
LTEEEVNKMRALYGSNDSAEQEAMLPKIIKSVVTEPMFILLVLTAAVYLILGEITEAMTIALALIFVAGIDVYQNFKSKRAVKALNKITSSKAKVIRSGVTKEIHTGDIVRNDIIVCEEGTVIPADDTLMTSFDFAVNEAIVSGESASVFKSEGDEILQGTLVVSGYCYAKVTATGKNTTLSAIGKLVKEAGHSSSPLQLKVGRFVRTMVIFGSMAFLFVWVFHAWESGSIIEGLLHGLAMAMSVLPEELPVALSTFMALGAYRLMKVGIIAKSPQTVETLGSATVICVDKTGTLTQNLMQVAQIYEWKSQKEILYAHVGEESVVLEYAMWASEKAPFDPMEKSIHEQFGRHTSNDERGYFKMVKEFPLSGKPPVMTHIFENRDGSKKIACKGSLEGVVRMCDMNSEDVSLILKKGQEYARQGFRVLGVSSGNIPGDTLPDTTDDIHFTFLGLITFYDPPDKNMADVIQKFRDAGVRVIMITGDYPETAKAVAQMTGIHSHTVTTGAEIESMDEKRWGEVVTSVDVFARISPEQKLKIIEALKSSGEIVAMTGDGVNDAPALKAAHIGVAMGKRGTEVAREAAGLILSQDNLSKMVDAIFLGRRIYENLRKAFRYIISIHIPIILLVTLPIFIGWLPSMLFAPVHVIFLELIMGPTCSIIYENEPYDERYLTQPSQSSNDRLFNPSELRITILQGLVITIGCLLAGYFAFNEGKNNESVRAYIFSTLIFSNIFLTLVNRSFRTHIWHTLKRKNKLIPIIIMISTFLLLMIHYILFLNGVFMIQSLTFAELSVPLLFGAVSTLWIEFFKPGEKGKLPVTETLKS